MEGYLAQSYTGLGTRTSPDASSIPVPPQTLGWQTPGELLQEKGSRDNISWTGIIRQQYQAGILNIPYKEIEVVSQYFEEDPDGNKDTREIKLVNFVPYPYMHAEAISVLGSGFTPVPVVPSGANYLPIGQESGWNILNINVRFETSQDILVFYNIAVTITNRTGIAAADTIQTAVFVDGVGPQDLKTETPILTQPLINNVTAFTGLARLSVREQGHQIDVRWRKGTNAGTIELREANLIIIATENLN
jgi:hypothetical protein